MPNNAANFVSLLFCVFIGHVMPCPYRVLRSYYNIRYRGGEGVIVGYAYTNVTQA